MSDHTATAVSPARVVATSAAEARLVTWLLNGDG